MGLIVIGVIAGLVAAFMWSERTRCVELWRAEWSKHRAEEAAIDDGVSWDRKPAPHVHEWHEPPPLDLRNDRATIEFALVGQVCDCGARRVFEGPARGFRMLPAKDADDV